METLESHRNYLYDVLLPAATDFKISRGEKDAVMQAISKNGRHRIIFGGLSKAKQKKLNSEWEAHCESSGLRNDISIYY